MQLSIVESLLYKCSNYLLLQVLFPEQMIYTIETEYSIISLGIKAKLDKNSIANIYKYLQASGRPEPEKEEMSMGIRMNTEDVIARGQEIASHVEDVTTLQNYLNDVVNNQLPELWEGSGYEGFAARVAEMAPSFDAMRELISDIGQGVVTNAQQYADFDQAAGAANRG